MAFKEKSVITEVYVDGEWVIKPFEKIEAGETFRTYKDYDNKIFNTDNYGNWAFTATKKCHTENGFGYQIDCHPAVGEFPL